MNEEISKNDILNKYKFCLYNIQMRMNVIENHLSKKYTEKFLICEIEFLCLQFRKILENIAFSSMCININKYKKIREKYYTDWNIKGIFREMEKINPNFYPKPVIRKLVNTDSNGNNEYDLQEYKGNYLTKEDIFEIYNKCSNFIHESNPFMSSPFEYNEYINNFRIWLSKTKNLMKHHIIHIDNNIIIGIIDISRKFPEAYIFEEI